MQKGDDRPSTTGPNARGYLMTHNRGHYPAGEVLAGFSSRGSVETLSSFFSRARTETAARKEDSGCGHSFSLASAMRGMENEDSPYSLDDLKETFR